MTLPERAQGKPGAAAPGIKDQTLAQAIYLAQLSALKGNCQCNTCKILRKASDAMVKTFLSDQPAAPVAEGEDLISVVHDQESPDAGGGGT